MDNWTCMLCGEEMPAEEIIQGNHFRLMHPGVDAVVERWPDGGVVIYEDPDDGDGTFI